MGVRIPGFIGNFPGVPAFFFVSGFLIYASYWNAPGLRYFQNRFLRLYPGLVFVTLGGAMVTLIAHGWNHLSVDASTYVVWFVAQTTLGQAYNPALFRNVGVGVVNGSLWTLTTEILFYICVPIIVWMERRFRFAVFVLIVLSFVMYAFGPSLLATTIYREKSLYDGVALTPVAWGWMFGIGILATKYFDYLRRWLRYMPWLIIPMVIMVMFGEGVLFGSSGNRLGLVYFLCYIGLVLWFAFVLPFVRLPCDLSYGTYIWHMPIINLLLVLSFKSMALAVVLTFAVALLSWFAIEKPALKLKRKSLKPISG